MPGKGNINILVKDAEDRPMTVNGNLAMVVEILIDLARAHNHPACAELWPTTAAQSQKTSTSPNMTPNK